MMLPEHKRELIEHRKAVAESLEMRIEIVLRIYYPFEELSMRGVVDRVDLQGGRVMVDGV